MIDRRSVLAGVLAVPAGSAVCGQPGAPATSAAQHPTWPDPHETVDLWPTLPARTGGPLPAEIVRERSRVASYNDRYVLSISRPRMAVFRPAQPNGSAALIFPGGGYRWVVVDKEGYELARWLVDRGVTAFVLFYRLPSEGWAAGPDAPLADAQRAVRLIRHRATSYGVDPKRICTVGFSAGGHVCASLMTRFAAQVYGGVDEADTLSSRPDLAAPIYPVISMTAPNAHAVSTVKLIGERPNAATVRKYNPALHSTRAAPPAFLLHAEDDSSVPVGNTLMLRESLLAAKVPVETHLFPDGGHGFGIRLAKGKSVEGWQEIFFAWARKHGVF